MKEQTKTLEKELSEMEIANLSDAQFKSLVIRMLRELTEYGNNMKKTQEEMKVTLSEIKKNLPGTISGGNEARIQMNDLEHKEKNKHSIETAKRKKNAKKMNIV